MSDYREEYDSIGYIKVSVDKKWGAQTQRSIQNFNISNELIPIELIKSIAIIKKCAAKVNFQFNSISENIKDAILEAADEVIDEKHNDNFVLSVWQTGSGTQTNMNVNEVISNIAIQKMGGEIGTKKPVHPNDHVNLSQSSNDTFPTAMHICCAIKIKELLKPSLEYIKSSLKRKSLEFNDIVKIGRTHIQDATPLTLGQEFSSYVSQIESNLERINRFFPSLLNLAQGGTAVGTGINSIEGFSDKIASEIRKETGIDFNTAKNKFEALSSRDLFVELSGILSCIATSLIKIANDIRLLSSGPRCGFGELNLPANEPGSSIMPGKVNPTQCEAVIMSCSQVVGNNTAVNLGCIQGGILQLNVCSPMIIYNILQSINLISDSCISFSDKCINGIEPNINKIKDHVENSLMLVTALTNKIGYDLSSKIAKNAHEKGITLRESYLEMGLSEIDFEKWVIPKEMINPKKV